MTSETAAPTYGGFWIRFWAQMADTAILILVTVPLIALAAIHPGGALDRAANSITVVIGLTYFAVFWSSSGSTPGMSALGLKVVRATDGTVISRWRAVGRYLALILAALPLGLGLLWAAWDERKRGWHDLLAGTVVVRVAPKHGPVARTTAHVGAALATIFTFLLVPVAAWAVVIGPELARSFREVGDSLAAMDTASQPSDAQVSARVSASSRVSRSPAPSASPRASDELGLIPADVPHDAPELEAILPAEIMGRPLTTWSVRGANYFNLGGQLTDADLEAIEAEGAIEGFTLDDFAMAMGGRSVLSDPPYLVQVIEVRGVDARELPHFFGIDYPVGEFEQITLAGKDVWRGSKEMLPQSEHLRGRPYLYDSGTFRFIVSTDDEWAADALRRLP